MFICEITLYFSYILKIVFNEKIIYRQKAKAGFRVPTSVFWGTKEDSDDKKFKFLRHSFHPAHVVTSWHALEAHTLQVTNEDQPLRMYRLLILNHIAYNLTPR